MIQLDEVSLRYGAGPQSVLALKGLTLEVGTGEFVAVVGKSGCGKSSLLKLLSGLMQPTTGTVAVHGSAMTRPRGNTGMAFQNPSLLPWRSTLENILLPLEVLPGGTARSRGSRQARREKARALLATVGLEDFADTHPKALSGGMKQRVSLCRALIHEPELLLLDEPFGALDAFTREELWGVLQKLQSETGCTVVLITHDLTEAVYLADTVCVMGVRPGRFVHSTQVPFSHPRDLEIRFTEPFVRMVAELRQHIAGPAPEHEYRSPHEEVRTPEPDSRAGISTNIRMEKTEETRFMHVQPEAH